MTITELCFHLSSLQELKTMLPRRDHKYCYHVYTYLIFIQPKTSIYLSNLLLILHKMLILPKDSGSFPPPSSFLSSSSLFFSHLHSLFSPAPHCFLSFSLSVNLDLTITHVGSSKARKSVRLVTYSKNQ